MRRRHVGCLIVTRDAVPGRVPVGMLTDRDIVTAIVARDVAAGTLRVEEAMRTPLVTAHQE
jgi:CBS domain-containing protein